MQDQTHSLKYNDVVLMDNQGLMSNRGTMWPQWLTRVWVVLASCYREELLHCWMTLIRLHLELSQILGPVVQEMFLKNKDKYYPHARCRPGTGPREGVGSPSLEVLITQLDQSSFIYFCGGPCRSRRLDQGSAVVPSGLNFSEFIWLHFTGLLQND